MPTTTNGFPYPTDSTGTNVPSDLQALANAADSTVTKVGVLTTKGDLVTRTATAEVRLPVGTNNQILKALASDADGMVWADQRMVSALTPIGWTELSTATATVTFSSIPATYTDLMLVWNGRSTLASKYIDTAWLRVNGSSSNVYDSDYSFSSSGGATGQNSNNQKVSGALTAQGIIGVVPAALIASTKAAIGQLFIADAASTAGTEKNVSWNSWAYPQTTHTIDFYSQGATTASASTTVHFHTSTAHSYIAGEPIQITGHTTAGYNGTFLVNAINAAITNTQASTSVCTITAPHHGLRTGDTVTVAAVSSAARYNGTFTVASAATSDTFTYSFAGSTTTSAANTGTVTGNKQIHLTTNASSALVAPTAAPANTFTGSNGFAMGNLRINADAAYSSVTFGLTGGTFAIGSTFALYGWTKI